jgi:hypothetical protein
VAKGGPVGLFVLVVIDALYGGAAGMLVPRFGIPKAVAIPVIPAMLLLVLSMAFIGISRQQEFLLGIAIFLAPAVVGAWLAFWLHSRWARKQRLREAGLIP